MPPDIPVLEHQGGLGRIPQLTREPRGSRPSLYANRVEALPFRTSIPRYLSFIQRLYPHWTKGKSVFRGLDFPLCLSESRTVPSDSPVTDPIPGKLRRIGRKRKTEAEKAAGRRQAVACRGRERTQRPFFAPSDALALWPMRVSLL